MKNILFILQDYKLDYYDFNKLVKPEDANIIAFVGESVYKKLSENDKNWFDGFTFVDEHEYPGFNFKCKILDAADMSKKLEEAISQYHNEEIMLYCDDESTMDLTSKLVEKYSIGGLKPKDILKFRDKVIMKEILEKNKIRVPKYFKLTDFFKTDNTEDYFKSIKSSVGMPFIIKPIDAAGSAFVGKISSYNEFVEYRKQILEFTQEANLEAEEFISGKMFSCDSVIRGGKIVFAGCTEYLFPYMEVINEGRNAGHIILNPNENLYKRITEFSKKTLNALQIHDCVTHMEMFLSDTDELVFIEVAARPAGVCMPTAYYYATGVNILHEYFYSIIGINRDIKQKEFTQVCGCSIYTSKNGILKKINQPNLANPYRIEAMFELGDNIIQTKTIIDNVINFYIYNEVDSSFRDDIEIVKNFDFFEIC